MEELGTEIKASPHFHITMLGGFQLSCGEKSVGDSISHTHQLWNLLEHLIAFRNKTVLPHELIEALWPDNSSDNPSNALKNLIYRIRTTLSAHHIPCAKELIVFNRGSYCWNSKMPCTVDAEEFERISHEAQEMTDTNQRISAYYHAIKLYKGDFLPGSSYEEWVISLADYYRLIYFKDVCALAELLMGVGRYDDICTLCNQAILIDPFEESLHRYKICALIWQNKQAAALDHYNYTTDLFYRELGIRPPEVLRDLYREITKTVNSIEMDLNVIKDDLREQEMIQNAYYCDYEVFKNLYRIEARSAARSGQALFVVLFTVTDPENNRPSPKVLGVSMDQLLNAIRSSLRKGDVISRFSPTQYVLMLSTLTYENAQMVVERVCKKYKNAYRPKNAQIYTTIQPLDPVL